MCWYGNHHHGIAAHTHIHTVTTYTVHIHCILAAINTEDTISNPCINNAIFKTTLFLWPSPFTCISKQVRCTVKARDTYTGLKCYTCICYLYSCCYLWMCCLPTLQTLWIIYAFWCVSWECRVRKEASLRTVNRHKQRDGLHWDLSRLTHLWRDHLNINRNSAQMLSKRSELW